MTKYQPDDEYQFDTPFGKTYHAVATYEEDLYEGMGSCGGCAFYGNGAACYTAPPCTHDRRLDGHSIIWVAA